MAFIFRKKKIRRILTFIAAVIGILLLGLGSYAGYLIYKGDSAIHRMAAAGNSSGEDEMANDHSNATLKPLIFLLAGIDSRDGSGGAINTDVLMLISFNPQTQSASILSLPRDLLMKPTTLPSRKANYYYAYYYIKDKASVIPKTKQFFSDLLELPIDHMVVLDFDALRGIVDAVGGLEIDVDMDMKYRDTADGTSIDLKKGLQKLDGQRVLDFVRYRKSNQGTSESSDFARNERQQQVIKQIIEKLGSFKGIMQWGNILDIFGQNVETDVSETDLRNWILNFSKIKPLQIHSLQLEAQWKSPYVYINAEDMHKALLALRTEVGLNPHDSLRLGDVIGVINN
ncbi:LytR family transcriptional regulator [Paenibacillus albiflavus]|uniref:LytR family transcriptional regulator n=1 Tax=Paenibacillus albiflavus TaxID=2545760 RepID=A0A4V2WPZ1_9BACL|nr:LCP family protein [Paenibacillus albiflavus]TCZ81282.1 LytR family transcriptional regulator [Paenibacillus albiflavus]